MVAAGDRITPLTPLRWLGRPLPLQPLDIVLNRLARRVVQQYPGLFDRIAVTGEVRLLLRPVDLPWQFLAALCDGDVAVAVYDEAAPSPPFTASIEGPLERLVDCANGADDGDALFFNRDIRVTGDTEVLLAIRNALDDAEIDLGAEFAALGGPLAPRLRRALDTADRAYRHAAHVLEQVRADLATPLRTQVDGQAREIAQLKAEVARLNRRARRLGEEVPS